MYASKLIYINYVNQDSYVGEANSTKLNKTYFTCDTNYQYC